MSPTCRTVLLRGDHGRERLRPARGRRAALQPLLHSPDRPPPGELPQEPVLAEPGARALRARAPRATHRHRAWTGAGAGSGLPEPHPPSLREARIPQAHAFQSGWAAEPSLPDGPRSGRLRPAQYALAGGDRVRAARPAR